MCTCTRIISFIWISTVRFHECIYSLSGLLRDDIDDVAEVAFQSYLGVVGSPPSGFEDFTTKVNKYMQLPPFNFPNPVGMLGGMKRVR